MEKLKKCSFCGEDQSKVTTIIAGPGVYICNDCVEVCLSVLERNMPPKLIFRDDFLESEKKLEVLMKLKAGNIISERELRSTARPLFFSLPKEPDKPKVIDASVLMEIIK